MTSIKMLADLGEFKNGQTVDIPKGSAEFLVNAGYAESAQAEATPPKRGRRTTARADAEASESESEDDSE